MTTEAKLEEMVIALAFELVVTPDTDGEAYDIRSVNFLDVEPEIR